MALQFMRRSDFHFHRTYRIDHFLFLPVFDAIASNIAEVLPINTFANVFVFGDVNVYDKDWLTYSGGIYRSETVLLRWLIYKTC